MMLFSFNSCCYIEPKDANTFLSEQGYDISVMHINCRSISKNFPELNTLLSITGNVTVLALSETWLRPDNEHLFDIPGYKYVCNSRQTKTGGGVALYISNVLTYALRTDLTVSNDFLECIFVDIHNLGVQKLTVGAIYRPPNTDVDNFNAELTQVLDKLKSTPSILAGDLNLDLIKADTHPHTLSFVNLLTSYAFLPCINVPTRVTEFSATLIDNFFINTLSFNASAAVIYHDLSDHYPILLKVNLKRPKQPKNVIVRRDFNEQAILDFVADLSSTNWRDLILKSSVSTTEEEVGKTYTDFLAAYKTSFDKFFPLLTHKPSYKATPRKTWLTNALARSCNKKAKLYKIYRLNPTTVNKSAYTAYRNKLKVLLDKAEKSYHNSRFAAEAHSIKNTWKLIKELISTQKAETGCLTFEHSGAKVTDKTQIVKHFNEFFTNVGPDLANQLPAATVNYRTFLSGNYLDSMLLTPTNISEILNITKNLADKKSYGADEIPLFVVKRSITAIAPVLCATINVSLRTGFVPDQLKLAKVCPIFKSGEISKYSNYRPISLLPSFSKIYEKVVYSRLSSYIEKKHIITPHQYGFRSGHSTYMALLDMYNRISKATDDGEISIGIFLDLKKAFDCLSHTILLDKLYHYGIRGIAHKWMTNYLTNRSQFVSYNGLSSSSLPITCGVPQGSILGPLLFLLYINDIVNASSLLHLIIFADDTNIFYSHKNIVTLMNDVNAGLKLINNWLLSNRLSLNISKTHFILFGSSRKLSAIKHLCRIVIDNTELVKVTETKFLGVMIDENVSWKAHSEYISSKLAKNVGILFKLRRFLNSNTLLMLYHALIHPLLSYCNIVWGNAAKSHLHKLEVLQKRAIRNVYKTSFRAHTHNLFLRSNILQLDKFNKYDILLFLYKVKHNMLPNCCNVYVTRNLTMRSFNARRALPYFNIEYNKTVARDRFVSRTGPLLWRDLPDHIQSLDSLSAFKATIKQFLQHYELLSTLS